MIKHKLAIASLAAISLAPAASLAQTAAPTDQERSDKAAADQAEYNALAAKYAAQSARYSAQADQFKAIQGSGIAGSATPGDGAGTAEAEVLAAAALESAAERLASVVERALGLPVDASTPPRRRGGASPIPLATPAEAGKDKASQVKRVVIFADTQATDTTLAEMFDVQYATIADALTKGTAAANGSSSARSSPEEPRTILGTLLPTLAAVSAALSYFKTDYTFASLKTTPDSYMLAAAVAGRLKGQASLAGQLSTRVATAEVSCELGDLIQLQGGALQALQATRAKIASLSKTNAASAEIPALQRAQDALETALSSYDTFASDIYGRTVTSDKQPVVQAPGPNPAPRPATRHKTNSTPPAVAPRVAPATVAADPAAGTGDAGNADPAADSPADTPPKLVSVIQQKSLQSALRGAFALFLKTQSSGGSSYTEKNIWSSLGTNMPFKVSGSVVVSYSLREPDGDAILAAGVITAAHGYVDADAIDRKLDKRPLPASAPFYSSQRAFPNTAIGKCMKAALDPTSIPPL